MAKNDGGSAFPHLAEHCQRINETEHAPGLTIRQWYAGMAMQGLLANRYNGWHKSEIIAKKAFEQAEAMIAEDEKEKD